MKSSVAVVRKLAVLTALILCAIGTAHAQSYVQSVHNINTSTTSLTSTLSGTVVAGDGLTILWQAKGTSPTISDSVGDTIVTDTTDPTRGVTLSHVQASAGGTVAVTVSQGTSTVIDIYAVEVSTPIKSEAASLVSGSQTTTPWSQDFTTAAYATEFIFANALTDGNNTGNTCVDGTYTTIGADGNVLSCYYDATATGTYTATAGTPTGGTYEYWTGGAYYDANASAVKRHRVITIRH